MGPKTERLTILRAATHETELGSMTSVSAGRIILTPAQPVGSGWPQRESNPGPPHQESRALTTELPPSPLPERQGEREGERQIEREGGGKTGKKSERKGEI